MASKQPFKFLDVKHKAERFYIRLAKVIKHKIMSKSRHALLLRDFEASPEANNFVEKLKGTLKKTWDIEEVNVRKAEENNNLSQLQKMHGTRQYDAIIVPPLLNKNLQGFSSLQSEDFACNLTAYNTQLFSNLLAYRMAHRYLSTGGVIIFSNSQTDFAKVETKDGQPINEQPTLKNILDAQTSYLAVTVGDRDYTDLNSWSVVGLSQQFVGSQYQDFVVKMYCAWADGQNLPMPGSFALFKMQEQGKSKPFVQYL